MISVSIPSKIIDTTSGKRAVRGVITGAAMDEQGHWWVLVACEDGTFRDMRPADLVPHL